MELLSYHQQVRVYRKTKAYELFYGYVSIYIAVPVRRGCRLLMYWGHSFVRPVLRHYRPSASALSATIHHSKLYRIGQQGL